MTTEPKGVKCDFLSPPLPPDLTRSAVDLVVPVLHEEFLEALLLGRLGPDAEFLVGIAREGERAVGHCWAGWGRGKPEIGVVAGVVTDERFRGRGIASYLVGEICRRFDAAEGRALLLGTTNDAARRIYQRLGFKNLAGQIYCRAVDGALEEGLNNGLATRARSVSWRDMAGVLPLHLMPHPCMVLNALIEFPSTRLVSPWRCFRLFWQSWGIADAGGRWEVLENSRGRIVASALAGPPGASGGFPMDFIWHADYSDAGREFVSGFIARAREQQRCSASLFICERDEWKTRAAQSLGFKRAVRAARMMDVPNGCWVLDEWRGDWEIGKLGN